MVAKSKVRSPAKSAKKVETKGEEKPQRERFIKAARDAGVDETGKEFEAALKKVLLAGRNA